MKSIISRKARVALGSALASTLVLSASVSFADDTEVFFGGPSIDTGIRPNVLFILDNSGSMQWRLASNNNPLAGEQSRLQVLKDSFAQIMSTAGAINAGVMVLNPRPEYNDTLMMYPVTNIDTVLPSSVQQVASTPRINGSGDDASQSSLGGGAVINGANLQMGYVSSTSVTPNSQNSVLVRDSAFFQSKFTPTAGPFAGILTNFACAMNENGSAHNATGDACGNDDRDNINIRSNNDTNAGNPNPIIGTAMLHFTGLNVPAAAGLSSSFKAYLDLVPTNTQNGGNRPTVVLNIQNAKVPDLPQSLTAVDTGRAYLAPLSTPNTPWVTGTKTRIEITNQVKDILDNDGASLTGLFLKMRATTATDYTLCLASGSGAPGSQCGTLAGGLFKAPTIVIEYNTTATTVETKSAALRFQDVGIPQGATIQTAQINFYPAAGNALGDALTLKVQAQLANDAGVITAAENVLGRPKTSATTWVVPEWQPDMPVIQVPGPSVVSQVQQVVSSGGWCGNNSMAFLFEPVSGNSIRTAFSYDGGIGLQPTLSVTYTGGESGCLNPILEATVSTAKDDAYQRDTGEVILDGTNIPLTTDRFAARFSGVPLNQGATILDAQVILTPNNTVASANVSSNIRFEQTDNASPLAGNNNNISDRNEAGASTCTINSWTSGTSFMCSQSGIKTGLQGIINRAGWAPGNALVITGTQSSTNTLQAKSFENNPGQAIKLRMKVAHGGLSTTGYTVRQHINALVQSMVAPHGTPIVPAYLEAAKYLRGEGALDSPITSACQPTHVVLLTDGQSNSNTTAAKSAIDTLAGSCSVAMVTTGDDPGIADTGTTDDGEKCGRKLSEWLLRTDQSTLEGDSFINTHTIGFAFGAQSTNAAEFFMRDIADNGGGGAYTADNASELTSAFSDILQTVQSVDTTFVSASAPVNSFERADNQDELYFSLFRPKASNSWPGNLKRYRFAPFDSAGNLNPQIVDQDNVAAIDFNTGGFKTDARSFWSASDDGNLTEAGGAAKQLPAAASRRLFTHISSSSPTSATALSNLATGNTAITNAMLNAADDTAREAQFNYIRGLSTDLSERKAIGDPIHSSPRLATYSCLTPNAVDPSKCDVPDQTAYIGTNEGLLQAFNTQTGAETFGFMPQELLANIKKRMLDAQSTSLAPRPYGLDNPVTLWSNDLNKDGKILASSSTPQAGEFVYAYVSMGRGGRNIYAMDVTDRGNPKILWYIKGGVTSGFAKLGQTWSAPIKSKINIGGTITDVLVFAGGYDELQDDASNPLVTNRTGDGMGNAIYVVNATTGSLIWSASNEASNASATQGHRQLTGMKYSIPANVRLIDLQKTDGRLTADPDKLADQLFVGDTGGQVWRLYINNGATGAGLITAGGTSGDGVFASAIPTNFDSLDAAAKLNNQRRFYNTPEVALMKKDGQLSLSVNIGSGYRGHPLKTETLDRFYSFRTSNLVDPAGTEGTLREGDLLNLTSNLTPTTDTAIATINGSQLKGGWFIPMTFSGEKVLTRALTTGSQQTIYFNTYQPSANTSSCTATFGTSRAYAVSLYDATATDPITGDPVPRFGLLSSPGIPPQPEEICIGDHCFIIKGPGTTPDDSGIDIIDTPPTGLMYWIDETDPGA